MRDSIALGRIAGIRVGLNISVVIIFGILVLGLGFGNFPATFPGRPSWAYLIAGLAGAALFLMSLLAHELAHALVAQRNGVEVSGITLWLLGGVAQLRGEPRTPGADMRIAVVGPLTSLVLAIAFGALAALTSAVAGYGLVAGTFAYLGVVNLILAVFNLIPAAPLDGGRVLRAFLWWRRGDRVRAAITAAQAGRAFGFVLIVLGLLQALLIGRSFDGLWLALIGLFLVNAATAEEQQARINAALVGVRVRDIMTPNPVAADAGQTVRSLIDRLAFSTSFSTYPLLDEEGRLRGLVTFNRLRSVPPERRDLVSLGEIACPPEEVPIAHPDEPLTDLLPRMEGCSDGRAVVVDSDGKVIGIITSSDISRALQVSALRAIDSYPAPRGADLAGPYDRAA